MYGLNLGGMFIGLFIAGVLVGLGLVYGGGWLWGVLKPLIHAATAG